MGASEQVLLKTEAISRYLDHMREYGNVDLATFLTSPDKQYIVSHLVELIVEASVDINGLVAAAEGATPASRYYDSFIRMGDLGFLDGQLARRLAATAGLRNRIAHEYEELDLTIVHKNIEVVQNLYPRYLRAVAQWIDRQPDSDE